MTVIRILFRKCLLILRNLNIKIWSSGEKTNFKMLNIMFIFCWTLYWWQRYFRLSIYGRNIKEWDMLADWAIRNNVYSGIKIQVYDVLFSVLCLLTYPTHQNNETFVFTSMELNLMASKLKKIRLLTLTV